MTKAEIIAEITTSEIVAVRLGRQTKSALEKLLDRKREFAGHYPESPVRIGDEVIFESDSRMITGMVINYDEGSVELSAPGFELVCRSFAQIAY